MTDTHTPVRLYRKDDKEIIEEVICWTCCIREGRRTEECANWHVHSVDPRTRCKTISTFYDELDIEVDLMNHPPVSVSTRSERWFARATVALSIIIVILAVLMNTDWWLW